MVSVLAQQNYHRALEVLHPTRFVIKRGTHTYDKNGTLLPEYVDDQPYDKNRRVRVWRLQEKQTDVNLAMSLYRDTAKGLYDQAVLCTNDSDAEPVLEALREDFPSLHIGVVTPLRPRKESPDRPHRTTSVSLARHAHWVRNQISDEELAAAQLPPKVPTKRKPILKPTHWQQAESGAGGGTPPQDEETIT